MSGLSEGKSPVDHRFSKHQLCALASLSGLAAWIYSGPLYAQTKAGSTTPVAVPVGTAPPPGTLGGVPLLNSEALSALQSAIKGPQRIEPARDRWRNPAATLQFFGVRPGDTVIEIWPGQGWYSSVLGPYLKQGGGRLVVGHFDAAASTSPVVRQFVETYTTRFGANPEIYGTVNVVPFGPRSGPLAPAGSVDSVLTFRNIHNWMAQGWAEKAFGDFFLALKPGGILGIEEHRGRTDEPQDPLARDGYVREDYVIQLAREAGFDFVGRSEINANPADTKDHPFGVWTLPPVSRTSAAGQPDDPGFDRARYLAIGESDRMTLRFRKPLSVKGTQAGKPVPNAPVVVVPAPPPPPPPRRPWIAPFIKPPVKAPPPPVAPVAPVPVPAVTPPVTAVPEAASTERVTPPPVTVPPPAPKPDPAPAPASDAPAPEASKPAIGAPETDMPVTVKPLEDVKPPAGPSAEKPPEKTETAPQAKPAPQPQPVAKPVAKPATKPVAKKPAVKPPAKPAPQAGDKSPPPPPAAPKAKPADKPKAKPAAAPPPKAEPKAKNKTPPRPSSKAPNKAPNKAPSKTKPDAIPPSKSPPTPAKAEKPDWIIPPKVR